jgi:hypothetical protein
MATTAGFICDVCGRHRGGAPHICEHCSSSVCDRCWFSQGGGKGHEMAEHKHEMAFKEGAYLRGDEGLDQ